MLLSFIEETTSKSGKVIKIIAQIKRSYLLDRPYTSNRYVTFIVTFIILKWKVDNTVSLILFNIKYIWVLKVC